MNSAWKEIKTSLNSTLATSNFKSLNKIMIDEFAIINQYVLEKIESLKLK